MPDFAAITQSNLVANKGAKASDILQMAKNFVALASARFTYHLGGSRQTGVPKVASAQDAIDWVDIELDGTNLSGLTVRARVELKAGASTAVTFEIRNMTTNAAMTLSPAAASCSATNADYTGSNQKQSCTFTPTTGVNKYRLRIIPANTTDFVFGIGYLEIFA